MLNIKKNKGFSLVEVLVASTIFMIAVAGLFAAFTKSRQNAEIADKRLRAAYIGRQALEELRTKVDSRNWDDEESGLALGDHNTVINGYTVAYTVTEDADLGGMRKVTMTVSW